MATATDVVTEHLPGILNVIAAIGALGTAAVGLVDTTKAFNGGLSNAGFKFVRRAVLKLISGEAADPVSPGRAFGNADVIATLRANWMNGVPKADQKAAAKGLIRLSLTSANAASIAAAVGVQSTALQAVVARIYEGQALGPEDLNLLGRFDCIVSAMLDESYERGDQAYRNVAKLTAAVIAIVLAMVGGGVLYAGHVSDYLASSDAVVAFLVGAVSTPLAPVAKDLATALTAATKAVGAIRR
jgi:hypothetical protein